MAGSLADTPATAVASVITTATSSPASTATSVVWLLLVPIESSQQNSQRLRQQHGRHSTTTTPVEISSSSNSSSTHSYSINTSQRNRPYGTMPLCAQPAAKTTGSGWPAQATADRHTYGIRQRREEKGKVQLSPKAAAAAAYTTSKSL